MRNTSAQLEPNWFNTDLARQACTSLPSQIVGWTPLAQNTFDLASLYKLARSKICWTNLVQTNFWPGELVQACRVICWTNLVQNCFHPATCASLPGQRFVEPTWFKQLLAWQACTSSPGQKLFEPTWFRMVQTKYSTLQACTSLPGRSVFEPTRWTNLVHNIVDPASLHKLAGQVT